MLFERNIGLITEQQQKQLSKPTVLIAGVGGMGGVAAEVLVRMGFLNIKICDHDRYEESNTNRQLYAAKSSYGKYKVDVLKDNFLDINPHLNIEAYRLPVDVDIIDELLDNVDYVINGMDDMRSSIILERNARAKGLTIVDAWLTPYASVFVMTPDSPHWEEFLDLPTKNLSIEELTEDVCNEAVKKEVEYTFSHFSPYDIITKESVIDVVTKKRARPSLTPVVWLSGVLMANELFKLVTSQKHTDYKGIFFDQYNFQLIKGDVKI